MRFGVGYVLQSMRTEDGSGAPSPMVQQMARSIVSMILGREAEANAGQAQQFSQVQRALQSDTSWQSGGAAGSNSASGDTSFSAGGFWDSFGAGSDDDAEQTPEHLIRYRSQRTYDPQTIANPFAE